MAKTNLGRFFEDYTVGQVIEHAVPRTVSGGNGRSIMRFTLRVMLYIRRINSPKSVACLRRPSMIWRRSTWFLAKPFQMCR